MDNHCKPSLRTEKDEGLPKKEINRRGVSGMKERIPNRGALGKGWLVVEKIGRKQKTDTLINNDIKRMWKIRKESKKAINSAQDSSHGWVWCGGAPP